MSAEEHPPGEFDDGGLDELANLLLDHEERKEQDSEEEEEEEEEGDEMEGSEDEAEGQWEEEVAAAATAGDSGVAVLPFLPRNRGMTSMEKKLRPSHRLWKDFCEQTGRQEEADVPQFLTADCKHDVSKMADFIEHLNELPIVTDSKMTDGISFVQHHLNKALNDRNLPVVKGSVGNIHRVKMVKKKREKARATFDLEHGVDIQALLNVKMSHDQMERFIFCGFCPRQGGKVAKISPVMRLQIVAAMRHLQQTMKRKDDIKSVVGGMMFTKVMKGLGPGHGTLCDYFVTNAGKNNQVGKKEFTAVGPHNNPLFDAAALLGVCLLFRFVILHEPFPDHLNWRDFSLRPLLRSVKSHLKAAGSSTIDKAWSKMHEECGVVSDKVGHLPRRQSMQEEDEKCAPSEHIITRMSGHTVGDGREEKSGTLAIMDIGSYLSL